jgi:electron transfer flavoprotein beta subunit
MNEHAALRIVVCAKEVLDPDAVNNYAIEGRLVIGDDGKTLTQTTIPRLMNAYDEQAIEVALRLRESGTACSIVVVSVGADPTELLKHAAALGADEIVHIPADAATTDYHAAARLLSAYVRASGGAHLVLCGRQASDDDQGVVPALVGELLAMPVVTIARALELPSPSVVRVTRVTPDGDEVVEAACPAVVTVSNEVGAPRYPTMAGRMAARRKRPTVVSPDSLGVSAADLAPKVVLTRQFVPAVHGNCEFIEGDTAAEKAGRLIARLRQDSVI